MDAYFASVELHRRPELKGLPVVIGGRGEADAGGEYRRLRSYVGRGVVTTATYPARAFGIRSGMGLMKAAALAPDAILLPGDYPLYSRVSRAFKDAVAQVAPRIEDRGIDEIFIDLTEEPGETRALALRIKAAVAEASGLTCSIGVTPNKLLSKIASELEKPDGLTILGLEDIPTRIWPLPCSAISGVGPKATGKLAGLGIHNIGDLARADPEGLVATFGRSYGAWLHEAGHGRDERPLSYSRERKSISHETTFERDLHPRLDRDPLSGILWRLCAGLARDLQAKGLVARNVGIKLRFEDFSTLTRDTTLQVPIGDPLALRDAARACLKRVTLDRRLRLLGVRAAGLLDAAEEARPVPGLDRVAEPGLFEQPAYSIDGDQDPPT